LDHLADTQEIAVCRTAAKTGIFCRPYHLLPGNEIGIAQLELGDGQEPLRAQHPAKLPQASASIRHLTQHRHQERNIE
jgi:hypothetical protein